MMQAIKDTGPEKTVRSIAHRVGLRLRCHIKNQPGRPDLVFPRYRTVFCVHDCLWHWHSCNWATTPKTRPEFWAEKFVGTRPAIRSISTTHSM
jgi:DNA mismatch endonuclease (patch repair protein)